MFEAVGQAHRHFGRLDVIVSNAGYGYMGALEELEPEQTKASFDTNVFGTLWVIQAALPILRAQGSGHILTVSSIGGVIGFPTGGTYTATKFAVEAMSEALAAEVAAFGIKVTIIEPGHFTTGFRAAVQSPPAHRCLQSHTPSHSLVIQTRGFWRSCCYRGGDIQSRGRQ